MDQKLFPNSKLGPYKIIRLIAKGGMGEVYEAYEEVLQRTVALKIITDKAITEIPEVLRLFITEGKALAQLNHPNVVTIYQLGHDQGVHYIAMEYIEGIPLDEYLLKNNHDLKRDLYIFYRILLGVQALHRKGIIHRDLKPKNVIIQGEKGVKIVDFGIAEIVKDSRSEEQQSTVVMGSVYYMSPEVATGGAATFQSDIWSLGVLLYQLMTRQRPFSGKSQEEILKKITDDTLAIPFMPGLSIPPKYKGIILKMCERSLVKRYQTIDEIIRELGTISSHQSSLSRATEILMGLGALLVVAFATMQILKGGTNQPVENQEPAVIAQVLSTSTTIPSTSITLSPEPVLPVVAQNSVSTTTLPKPPEIAARPPEKEKPAALDVTNLRYYQTKVILNFKNGTSTRDPASAMKSITNPPILAWLRTANADAYQIQLANNGAFTKPFLSKKVTNTSFQWESAQPGTYYWRVQALSKSRPRGAFSDVGTLQVHLPAPILAKSAYKFIVKSGDKSAQKNVISWKSVPLVSQFQVQISKKKAVVLDEVVRGNQLAFNNLPAGEYELQVTALDQKRLPASQPSTTTTVQILQASRLAPPTLQQPSHGTSVPSQGTMITPIACNWSSVKHALAYEFQLSSDPGFQKILHQTTSPKNQYVLILPLPRGKFYWRVRATSKDEDPSAWSEARLFTID
ncbi:MAG: protein kinase domain-containing protein [Pseudobdellovibrionaceae bacterium]